MGNESFEHYALGKMLTCADLKLKHITCQYQFLLSQLHNTLRNVQGGSNMTGTDCV
jgi:hypothetical protein